MSKYAFLVSAGADVDVIFANSYTHSKKVAKRHFQTTQRTIEKRVSTLDKYSALRFVPGRVLVVSGLVVIQCDHCKKLIDKSNVKSAIDINEKIYCILQCVNDALENSKSIIADNDCCAA